MIVYYTKEPLIYQEKNIYGIPIDVSHFFEKISPIIETKGRPLVALPLTEYLEYHLQQ